MVNDFGLAVRPAVVKFAPPAGTIAFAAEPVLEARIARDQITPRPEHDLEAAVKLIYSSHIANIYPLLQSAVHRDKPELAVLRIWKADANTAWYAKLLAHARHLEYDQLKTDLAAFIPDYPEEK